MTVSRLPLLLSLASLGTITAACAPPPPAVAPAGVAYETAPRGVVYADQGPPTMAYQSFAPQLTDEPRRQWLWGVFLSAQARAYTFDAPGRWKPLREIDYVDDLGPHKRGDWNVSGRIELVGKDDTGSLFHEIFHAAFYGSPLHAGQDGEWKEAFCDAFRYVEEKELLPPPASSWVKKIDELTTMNMAQVQAMGGRYGWKFEYGYPAAIIVRRAGGTSQGLYALWNELTLLRQRTGRDVLDQYFGYPMAGIIEVIRQQKAVQ